MRNQIPSLLMRTCFMLVMSLMSFLLVAQVPDVKVYAEKPVESVRVRYEASIDDKTYKHGFFKLYYRGQVQISGFYYKGLKQGLWEHFKEGKKLIEGYYLNGKKHGKWTYYLPDGKVGAELEFQQDLPTGTWRGFFPDRKPAAVYNYKNGRLEGEFVLYHPNGLIAQNTDIRYVDTNMYVSQHRYYTTGRLFEDAYFFNNEPDSTFKRYHLNGAVWEHFLYRKGELVAIVDLKTAQGANLVRGTFVRGKGEIRFYNANATLHSIVRYRDGFPSGKAQYFDRRTKTIEGVFMRGQRIGTWKYFSEFGKLLIERNFYDGSGLLHERLYTGTGSEGEEGEKLNGLRDGIWRRYNFYGDLMTETPYQLGYKHGTFKRYEGKVVMEQGGYHYGEKVGEWKYFNSRRKQTYQEEFIKQVSFDQTLVDEPIPNGIPEQKTDFNYATPIIEAAFPGGGSDEVRFIFDNLDLPDPVRELEIKGQVIIRVEISELGEMSSVQLVRGLGYGIDEEVLRIYKSMPFWMPKRVNGIPEASSFTRKISIGQPGS